MAALKNRIQPTPFFLLAIGLLSSAITGLSTVPASAQEPAGHLVIVGGGGTPVDVMKETIRLAGGNDAKVILISTASEREQAGEELKTFFASLGARNSQVLDVTDETNALQQLEDAKLIWMGGGSQSKLVESLSPAIQARISDLYRGGSVVGGTSAGAAAMSKKMITGQADLKSIRAQTTELADGLGLTEIIVDQHFHERQRFNRLLAAVLDHPDRLGIGIDENTAIIISRSTIHVRGQSSVLVLDARSAFSKKTESGRLHNATDVKLHVLIAGQRFILTTMKPTGSQTD